MIAPNDMNPVTLAAAKVRIRKSRSGSIGDAARRSHADEPGEHREPAEQARQPERVAPAGSADPHEAPGEQGRAARGEHRPRHVKPRRPGASA